jgi:uncharacterized protein (TIGR02268 family)
VFASPSFALLALVLMNGPRAAQPSAATCQTGVQYVELSATSTGDLPTVCTSPGQSTTLSFDSDFVPDSLALEGREKFTKVEAGQSTLKLVPSEKLVPGEKLKLTVRFMDDAAPTGAAMMLVVHAVQATPYVEVHRQKRTVESCERELREKEAALQQCRAENERLRNEQSGPGGLIGLRSSGIMDSNGVTAQDITKRVTEAATNALAISRVYAYRSETRVAVEVHLSVPEDASAWKPESATLVLQGRKGGELKVSTLWSLEPLPPGGPAGRVRVIVEAEATPNVTATAFTLKLWDASGARTVTIGGITFP